MKTGWSVSSCDPSSKATPKDLARLEFSHHATYQTPDGAMANARRAAKVAPELAFKVCDGPTPRWLLWRGTVWGITPSGGVEVRE